ncbi:hypothetical protein BHE74_00052602 [Ensete ventricosum]|nr:hypothetical protein BHE74_00052602 [Ensete ventricosum]
MYRLSRQLEKLVYVHYNMWLRLRCAKLDKELEEPKIDPIDLQFYNEDSESNLECIEGMKNQGDPLLDEAGDPQLRTWRKESNNIRYPTMVVVRPVCKDKGKGEDSSINYTVGKNRVRRRNTFTIAFRNSLGPET